MPYDVLNNRASALLQSTSDNPARIYPVKNSNLFGTVTSASENVSVKRYGKQHIDINTADSVAMNTSITIDGNDIIATTNSTSSVKGYVLGFDCLPNTSYCLSFSAIMSALPSQNSAVMIRTGISSGDVIVQKTVTKSTEKLDYEIPFNSGANSHLYLWLYVQTSASTDEFTITYSDIMIELGNAKTTFEAFTGNSYTIPIIDGTGNFNITALDGLNVIFSDATTMNIAFNAESLNVIEKMIEDKLPVENSKNLIDTTKSVDGFIGNTGILEASSTYRTSEYIPVKAGESYLVTPKMRFIAVFNTSYSFQSDKYISDTTPNYIYTAAADGFIRISYFKTDESAIQCEHDTDFTGYMAHDAKVIKSSNIYLSRTQIDQIKNLTQFWGKTLLNLGDSIAQGSTANKSYGQQFAIKYGMIFISYATGGATISKESVDNNIPDQLDTAISAGVTPDYILFNGGTNDISAESTVGAVSSGYDAVLDLNTFCGGFEYICKTILDTYKGIPVWYVRSHNMSSRPDADQQNLGVLAEQICAKWGVPIINVYKEGMMNTNIASQCLAYTLDTYESGLGDGTHPNALAYTKFYLPLVEKHLWHY